MNIHIKRFLFLGLAFITTGLSKTIAAEPPASMLSFTKPISYPTGGNQTDIYIDNRTQKDILVDIPGYEYQIVTPSNRDGSHKKIFAISPQDIAIGSNKPPHFTFYLLIDGVNVTIDCWSSKFWNNLGAGVRVNSKYTERSAAVAGISQESIVTEILGVKYEIFMQVYPFNGAPNINIIIKPA